MRLNSDLSNLVDGYGQEEKKKQIQVKRKAAKEPTILTSKHLDILEKMDAEMKAEEDKVLKEKQEVAICETRALKYMNKSDDTVAAQNKIAD